MVFFYFSLTTLVVVFLSTMVNFFFIHFVLSHVFQVIMQPADFFNLEFAPEPNPDMPGEYTARRRYINATRVFNFLPDNVCCNHQLSDEGSFGCTDSNDCLELTNKKNIIGKL